MRAGILDPTDGQIAFRQRSRAFVANPALLEFDSFPFAGILTLRFGHKRILTRNAVPVFLTRNAVPVFLTRNAVPVFLTQERSDCV